ncbi:hypothetical protein EMCRGX_G017964 [Ephydatia muelleri]
MARRAARREKDCCASVPQHPYDSTARGMHTHPSSAHFESLALCFLASANRAEDPHLTPASVKVIGLSGEVTVRSKAAGLPISSADSKCPLYSSALDPDCHHAFTCRSGGDIIAQHNKLRDCFANLCSKACLSPQLEKGPGLDFSRPADVLVSNWFLSNPAAFDLKVIHLLNTDLILEASLASGNSAEVGEIELKVSRLPHFEILGCPIGDYIYCANFIASKHLEACKLLLCLIEVAAIDPQAALTLLRLCGRFCRLSYLARSTPTNLVSDAFKLFDDDVHHCFIDCIGFETSDEAWCQAQLGLNSGGLGLRSLSLHSSSAFIASFCSSGVYDTDDIHLTNALDLFSSHVSPIEKLSVNSVVSSPVTVRSFCLQK